MQDRPDTRQNFISGQVLGGSFERDEEGGLRHNKPSSRSAVSFLAATGPQPCDPPAGRAALRAREGTGTYPHQRTDMELWTTVASRLARTPRRMGGWAFRYAKDWIKHTLVFGTVFVPFLAWAAVNSTYPGDNLAHALALYVGGGYLMAGLISLLFASGDR